MSYTGVVSAVGDANGVGVPDLPRPFRRALLASFLVLLAVAACTVVLPVRPAGIIIRIANTTACAVTAVCCIWTGWRARGAARRWRLLIGLAAAGATTGYVRVIRALWEQGFYVPPLSAIDASYLLVFALVLAGLLTFPTEPVGGVYGRRDAARQVGHRWHVITVLDSVLIVGSIILLAWSTVLGKIARAGVPDAVQFAVMLGYGVANLILVVAVVLLMSFRRPRSGAALALLGGGLAAISVQGSMYLYFGANGVRMVHPAIDLVLLAGFLSVTLACLAPSPVPPSESARGGPRLLWIHAMLPYAALCSLGLLFLGQILSGSDIGRPELYGVIGLLLLALVRQLMTLMENTQLMAQVQAGQRQLHYQAYHDPLTGLANRTLFADRLEQALARLARDHAPVALVFCDLDGFKWVNDTLGHAAGDELLRIVADRLREAVRSADTVARLGGDEFAVILSDGPDHPEAIGRRLVRTLQAPCVLAGQPYTIRASLGLVVADLGAGPVAPDTLLHQADIAMYAAKRQVREKLVHYRPQLSESGSEPILGGGPAGRNGAGNSGTPVQFPEQHRG